MKLTLQRRPSALGCTIGELFIDGVPECFTLEDVVREVAGQPPAKWKIAGKTAIGAGIYDVTIDMSTRFQRLMIHILNVLGFDGIRAHAGNKAVDTDGCVLVGLAVSPDGDSILHSVAALAKLQPKIQAALDRGEAITIEILNASASVT